MGTKLYHTKTNFSAGMVSPLALGHVDLDRYLNGCEDIVNFIPMPLGGMEQRPGTKYVAFAKEATARLLTFNFSATQTYVIEFGNLYLRFFTNQGQLLSTAAVTNGTFDSDISGWTDLSSGTGSIVHNATDDRMTLAGGSSGIGSAEQALTTAGIAVHTVTLDVLGDDITYQVGTTSGASDLGSGTITAGTGKNITFTPATDPDTVYVQFINTNNDNREVDNITVTAPYEIVSPFTTAQVDDLRLNQAFDELYICHGDVKSKILRRLGSSSWDIIDVASVDGPYLNRNEVFPGTTYDTTITLTPAAVTGTGIVITASSAIFTSDDVGRQLRFRTSSSTAYGYGEIVTYTSSTVVEIDIVNDLPGTAASDDWFLGAWGGRLKFPILPIFHEQRLWFLSSSVKQQAAWTSAAGDYLNFSPDNSENKGQVDDDTAFALTIATLKSNPASWAVSKSDLQIGSHDIQISISAPSNEALTPFNVTARPINSKLGSVSIPAIFTQNAILFGDKYGKKIYELGYFFEDDSYRATDLTIMASLVIPGTIKTMVRYEEPYEIIWILTTDGKLYSCTYLRAEKIIAFAPHVLGGVDVDVKSIATISGSNGSELWLSVSRTINSSTVTTVERLTDFFNINETEKEDAFYVDCGSTYSGSSTTTVSGLDYLESEVLAVLGDGSTFLDKTVTNGIITIGDSITKAQIGYNYTSSFTTVPIVKQLSDGSSLHRLQSVVEAKIHFYKSLGVKFGRSVTDAIESRVRTASDPMNSSAALFTGIKTVGFTSTTNTDSKIYVEQSLPQPCTVLSITSVLNISE